MRHAVVLTLLLFALPLAAGQGHEHETSEGTALVLHDGPDDGRAVAGGLTHFGFALLKDGVPQVHRNAAFEVLLDGTTVFATNDTHEYDGLFSFDVVFPHEGAYEVRASSEGMETGVFTGLVVAPANATEPTLELRDVRPVTATSSSLRITLAILDADGTLLNHTDALLELREPSSQRLVYRLRGHIHDEPIVMDLDPGIPGDYELHATAYRAFPTGRSPDLLARSAVFPLSFPPGISGAGANPFYQGPPMDPLSPTGPVAEGNGYRLHAMVDPQAVVPMGGPLRVAALLVDAEGRPVPHVDFTARLATTLNQRFSSASLHEYDGAFEAVLVPVTPGHQVVTVVASSNGTDLEVRVPFEVLPPAAPLNPGVYKVKLSGTEALAAGEPAQLGFALVDDVGRPLPHGEVDVTLTDASGQFYQQFKLHSHASGTMAATVLFPAEGEWRLHVQPATLMPQASFVEPVTFALTVASGATGPLDALAAPPEAEALEAPAPGFLLALLGAGLAAGLRRK